MVAPSDSGAPGEPPKKRNRPKKPELKPGRPCAYDPLICPGTAFRLCQMGATSAEIAEAFGCGLSTLYEWFKEFPELWESVKRGKAAADDLVEQSLYQRARGFSHPDVQINVLRDGTVIKTDYIKVYPPSETAMIFWLKNRRPREWRDRIDLAVEVDVKLSDAEQALAFAQSFRATAPIMQRVASAIEMRTLPAAEAQGTATIAPEDTPETKA